ncbi:hypothetical protein SAMN05660226_02839 [Parapedobacter luteus]|uniref:Lipoprotein n=1 Tax=Parapedobacter luteus TaxID=623280 RepID=A0A1T5DMA5_9SPHI|nr:hypothetical protein [Parapedobacter luteus]SKB72819.1 hypothetical protein SAMN05660226_02839 [Parapedobacter luteus]
MENRILIYSIAAMLACLACSKEGDQTDDGNIISLNELSSNFLLVDDRGLLNKVQTHLDQDKLSAKVSQIEEVKFYESADARFYLVSYKLDDGDTKEIAIRDNLVTNQSTGISCRGQCTSDRCRIEGEIDLDLSDGDDSWSQCSCTACEMHVTTAAITESENETLSKGFRNIEDLAKKSFLNTFGTPSDKIAVTKVDYFKDEKVDIQTFTYEGSNGIESTFMVVRALVDGISANGVEMAAMDTTIIDCTGSCDCRERYYPGTGAVECTCSDCKMIVETEDTEEG